MVKNIICRVLIISQRKCMKNSVGLKATYAYQTFYHVTRGTLKEFLKAVASKSQVFLKCNWHTIFQSRSRQTFHVLFVTIDVCISFLIYISRMHNGCVLFTSSINLKIITLFLPFCKYFFNVHSFKLRKFSLQCNLFWTKQN